MQNPQDIILTYFIVMYMPFCFANISNNTLPPSKGKMGIVLNIAKYMLIL